MLDPSACAAPCPNCGHRLWKQRRGEWTLHQRMVKLVGPRIVAVCPECSGEVDVPFLQIVDPPPLAKAPRGSSVRRLVVRVDVPRRT